MKLVVASFLALSGMVSLAQAETEFNGSLCFTSVNTACQSQGWNAGGCFGVRFAPRNVGTNGADTEISLFARDFAVGFRLASGDPVAAVPFTVTAAKVARGGLTYSLGFRLTSLTPTVPTTSTGSLSFVGVFTNWDQITGCTVNFRGAGTRAP